MNIWNWLLGKKNVEERSGIYSCFCGQQIATGLPKNPTWKQMVRKFEKEHKKHKLDQLKEGKE